MRDLNRIAADGGHGLTGRQIDRTQPLRFRLNGREIDGYAGDTLLSAVLASGFTMLGMHAGWPLGLRAGLAMAAKPRGAHDDRRLLLPLDRTPAADGLDLEIGAPLQRFPTPLALLKGKNPGSLGVALDRDPPSPAALMAGDADIELQADIAIAGGGIAGLAAAERALALGKSVILVERRGYLGGNAALFGQTEGQETPEKLVARLEGAVNAGARCLLLTEVLDIRDDALIAHQVEMRDGRPLTHLVRIRAHKIVLATGSADRLPVFQGNRLPAVHGLEESWHLATAYGVWPGKKGSVFAGSDNIAYSLALMAQEAGVPVVKIFDSRLDPQTRYAEFAKASGIRLEAGLRVASVQPGPAASPDVLMAMELGWEGSVGQRVLVEAGSVIASGGWQPRLTLWHRAGGRVAIGQDGIVRPGAGPDTIIVAGSAAGYLGNPAVVESGMRAAEDGVAGAAIDDPQIDPAFESPQDILPVAATRHAAHLPPAYYGDGPSLVACPREAAARRWFHRNKAAGTGTGAAPIVDRALAFADICAMAAIDRQVATAFGTILEERCVAPVLFTAAPAAAPQTPRRDGPEAIPAYLEGRFGPQARLWLIEGIDGAASVCGDLLFVNTDLTDPAEAIGVVLSGGVGGVAYAAVEGDHITRQVVARSGAGTGVLTLSRQT